MHFISRFPLTFFFFLSIYIYFVHLVAMIRIKFNILQKIFRISRNVKRDVYKYEFFVKKDVNFYCRLNCVVSNGIQWKNFFK